MGLIICTSRSIDPNDPNYQNNDNRGRLDASYLKTRHGILKLFELVTIILNF